MDLETTKSKSAHLFCRVRDEAAELGFLYAAYTDGDEVGMPPRFDELTRQALKVRDLQRQLREMA
jgi:hypothetical protein